ncbi:MAG TPA: DUF485 domain-containing protein [Pseudonocardia sp.]|uniref:DUF485 domain-containing protein n=1 Tax=Pseudonocardia sp. TaxID=60912 RepID=UPI002F3E8C96
MQRGADFADLRRRLRRFAFPMSIAFLLWYLLYVLLAAYAPEFMSIKLDGNITVGLLIGVLQFVSTFVITTVYVRYANRNLDPAAARLRDQIEGGSRR